jgi:hypothetical protein
LLRKNTIMRRLLRVKNLLKSLTPQTITAIMATFVSLCSLFVSIYQTQLSRKQQYASVWPNLLIFSTTRMENDAITAGYTLWNQGIGPAIIREVKVWYNGQAYSEAADAMKALYRDLGRDANRFSASMNSLSPGFSFAPNQNWDWVLFYEEDGRMFQEYAHLFAVEIRFASVYGEEWLTKIGYQEPQLPKKIKSE